MCVLYRNLLEGFSKGAKRRVKHRMPRFGALVASLGVASHISDRARRTIRTGVMHMLVVDPEALLLHQITQDALTTMRQDRTTIIVAHR